MKILLKPVIEKILLAVVCLTVYESNAQTTTGSYSVQGWWGPAAPPFSPVVEKNNGITFRVKSPKATQVNLLFGEWSIKPQSMTKDTAGVWSITIPPVEPGIYSYQFSIDGITTLDLNNPVVKSGTELYGSVVEVAGNPARFDEIQNVPHGTLQELKYLSTPLQRIRAVKVYLPPQYYTSPSQKFPVLYLRHGGGDNETSWSQPPGRADIILENLIAAKKAVPMIIVMTNGLTDGSWSGGSTKEGMEKLEQELLKDVMPLVEKRFRTKADRNARAITGLSMGGGQAYVIGLRNLDKFAWVGEFSSGLLSDAAFDINERAPGIFNDPGKVNNQLKLLWIGCGTDDPRFPGHTAFSKSLEQKNIQHRVYNVPGGHEWKVWRLELEQFMQQLFK
jgi:enterochelin esterase family protein